MNTCTLVVTVDGIIQQTMEFASPWVAVEYAYGDTFRKQYDGWENVEVYLVLSDERVRLWETPFDAGMWLARQGTVRKLLDEYAKKRSA